MADNVDDIAAAAAAEDAVSVAETGTFAPSTKDFDDGEFVDEDFPPSSLAVFGPDGPQPPADGSIELPSPHSWRRFSDLWPLELLPPSEASLPPQVVQQGAGEPCRIPLQPRHCQVAANLHDGPEQQH